MKQLKLTFLLAILMSMVGSKALAYDAKIDGIAYYFSGMKARVASGGNYSGKVVIPVSITYNGKTYSVTSIGYLAFYGCTGLTSIEIPNSVTSIDSQAFLGCRALTSVKIPNSVTSIGYKAFAATGLTSIEIPNSVTSIGDAAFEDTPWYNNQPDGLIYVGKVAYRYKGTMPANTSITIKEGTLEIVGSAFYNCNGLISVKIPNSVTSIGDKAFGGCPKLMVFCNRQTPPSAEDNTFNNGVIGIVPLEATEAYRVAIGWRNLFVNGAFIAEDITQTTITLATSEKFSNTSVKFGDQEFTAVDGKVKITGLKPNREYSFLAFAKYDGIDLENTITVQTKTVSLSCYNVDRTNLTATLKGSYDAGDATVSKHGFVNMSDNVDEVTLNGLIPGESYTRTYYVECGEDCIFTKEISFSTRPVYVAINETHGVTTCTLNGSYSVIDATVTGYGFTDSPDIKKMTRTGLNPNTSYSYTFYVETKEGGRITKSVSFRTNPLSLTTQQPKVVSVGNVVVAAETNLDEEETNVGFEWRRIDWTDDFASNTGTGYLYEGTMEGYIRNLYAEKLWKYRPYYESNSGTRYYGDWVGIDPTNTSYFEPTVHTYATISVKGNEAMVKGYAMTGSDKITSQGFKYWTTSATTRRGMAEEDVPADAMTVTAKGQVMTTTLKNLKEGTEYCYVAFATTEEGDTYYGELQTFTTEATVLLGDADGDGTIDVNDVTTTINHILGKPVANFVEEAANVDGDDSIDVNDVQGIIDIALGKTKAAARKMEEVEEHEETLDPQ